LRACRRINRSILFLPHSPGAQGPIARKEAEPSHQALVAPAALGARLCQPSIEPASRDTEHLAQFLREVGRGFFRMSRSCFSLATSRLRRAVTVFIKPWTRDADRRRTCSPNRATATSEVPRSLPKLELPRRLPSLHYPPLSSIETPNSWSVESGPGQFSGAY
jgi:hypothetical protein